jgi:hypothetical protein
MGRRRRPKVWLRQRRLGLHTPLRSMAMRRSMRHVLHDVGLLVIPQGSRTGKRHVKSMCMTALHVCWYSLPIDQDCHDSAMKLLFLVH